MVVLPFPTSSDTRDRLTDADAADLFALWPKGEVIDVETAISTQFNCFLATGDDAEYHFVFWRESNGRYVREDTRTGQKVKGESLAEVMPRKAGLSNDS